MNKTWISFHLCSGLVLLPSAVIRMYDIVVISVVLSSKEKIFSQSLAGIFEQTCESKAPYHSICQLIISRKKWYSPLASTLSRFRREGFAENYATSNSVIQWRTIITQWGDMRNKMLIRLKKKLLLERKREILDEQDVQDGQDYKAPW